jgi:hypothetical protein
MFETTIELMDRLCDRLAKEHAVGLNLDLASEARRRLLQLDYLLNQVHRINSRYDSAFDRVNQAMNIHIETLRWSGLAPESVPQPEDTKLTEDEFETVTSSMFEMKLFTECFYYIAGRLRTLLRKSEPIQGLKSFECPGARDVRNQLLEHPEGKYSQVFIESFGFGKENGPALKAMRYAGQEHVFPDKGLYCNATEIKEVLEHILQDLLNAPA